MRKIWEFIAGLPEDIQERLGLGLLFLPVSIKEYLRKNALKTDYKKNFNEMAEQLCAIKIFILEGWNNGND